VQDVARVRSWEIRQEGGEVGDERVRGRGDHDRDGFSSLSAAAARHAQRRTGAVVASGQLVACARLVDDEAGKTRRAEREQADDDRQGEPVHELILAFDRVEARVAC
jgi:hypothetical protein